MADETAHGNKSVSKIFNDESSDFSIVSTDGVKLFIPKLILQYSSSVFGTMFELGGPEAGKDTCIPMQGNSTTLETIFRFAHPGMANPTISSARELATLFQVAKQYEMETVTDNLKKAFLETPLSEKGVEPALISLEPLLCLIIAYQFDCPLEARLALREVLRVDFEAALKKARGFDVPVELMQILYARRRERSDWLWDRLWELMMKSQLPNQSGWGHSASSVAQKAPEQTKFMKDAVKKLKEMPTFSTLNRLVNDPKTGGVILNLLERVVCAERMPGWEAQAK